MKYTIIILFFLQISVFSDILPQKTHGLFLNTTINGSLRIPISSSSINWKRYPTAGFKLEFPSTLKDFHISAGIEGGRLHDQNRLHTINCLHLYLGLMYENQLFRSKIWIYPQVGLVSMMISDQKLSKALTNAETFSDVENEYGVSVGCEPRLKFRNFFVGLPISIERIFSSPEPFDSFVIAIRTGYTFKK